MVTVPLPATIVPVTLVVLHPAPVQTEIGSALAVPWAKPSSPKTASARQKFLRFENLGIQISLGVDNYFTSGPQTRTQTYVLGRVCESEAGQMRAQKYQPDGSLG